MIIERNEANTGQKQEQFSQQQDHKTDLSPRDKTDEGRTEQTHEEHKSHMICPFFLTGKEKSLENTAFSRDGLMRITGLEPARHGHQNLNLARLPIPPYPHTFLRSR